MMIEVGASVMGFRTIWTFYDRIERSDNFITPSGETVIKRSKRGYYIEIVLLECVACARIQ